MKKLLALAGFLVLFMVPAKAQETPKIEISGGFAYRTYYVTKGVTTGMNGWYASADYNFMRRLGVEAEVLGVYKNQGLNGKSDLYTALVGPQIFPFGHRKLTPFAHILFGGGHYRLSIPPFGGLNRRVFTDTAFAWEGGGGVDLTLSHHWALRLIEADFGTTRFFGGNPSQGSRRISAGIIYRFGKK